MPGFSLDASWKSSPYNAVTEGDIDGDGFEEVVLLWWNEATTAVTLTIIDDKSEAYEYSSPSALIAASPRLPKSNYRRP